MAVHTYILAPYDANGRPPEPMLEYLIVAARSCSFIAPINVPYGFASATESPAPKAAAMGQGYAAFGEAGGYRQQQPQNNIVHTNPNVDPAIKALLEQVKAADPQITMNGLLRNSGIRLGQVVLVDGNCVNFHALGICKRGNACNFQHDASARPSADRVNNFINLVKPLAEGVKGRRPGKRNRGGG
jgi:hypothetical protein